MKNESKKEPQPPRHRHQKCKVREVEKARFGKRMSLALYRNISSLLRQEGAAVRLVNCCAKSRREYIENRYMRRYIILRGSIFPQTVETVSDFTLGGSKVIADDDCSHEIKRRLLLGRKIMTNLDSILKSRDVTLATKVHLVKAMVFPVVMYGCESWTVRKAEHRKIDAFELWCWRRLLRVLSTARRSNQSILKEISPGCSLEGLMLKLKLHGHLMQRVDSLEKTLMLGGIGGRRRRGRQRMRWLDGITN